MNAFLRVTRGLLAGCFFCEAALAQPPAVCPVPNQQNISYASVTKLDHDQPAQIVRYGDDQLQFAEFWPASATAEIKSPVVALIHGGCWLNAFGVDHTHALSSALAQMGYAVWSLEYRRSGDIDGGWPTTFDDVVSGLNALAEYESNAIDNSRVAVVGHSAGGHLALLASTSGRLLIDPKVTVGLAPIVDVATYAAGSNSCQQATPQFMGGSPDELPEAYLAATPNFDAGLANRVIALHGDLDQIVPLSQSAAMPRQIIKGAGHFDFVHPHTPAFQALLRVLGERL